MEEILALESLLLKGDIPGALAITAELEQMSCDDIVNKIRSYGKILLLYLIKQQAEQRTTRSWNVSIRNSMREINSINKRRKAGGYYLTGEELYLALDEAYPTALDAASLEVEEGNYTPEELETKIDREDILSNAFSLIATESTNK